ncbi:MAG: methyl-accepting chemotaxis protein [Lachnospiraceae bacterium]|jgi:methyl-accepting chemotaxis protein|nr:methyl-accepting chemotaxis protein [Lachnospiraceae bacterium]
MEGRKYRSIGRKVGYVVMILQAISGILAVAVCVSMFTTLVTKMQKEQCTNGTSMLALELEQASADTDLNQMLDDLKSRMNCEFTIFEGDTRAYSTVIQDGKRVTGTRLSSDVSEIVLQKGQAYVGEAMILEETYLCSYVPTRGADGQINGLIFAGISMAEARQETAKVIVIAALVSLLAIVLCGMVMAAYLKKRVSVPLGEITRIAARLEKGDLGLAGNEEVKVDIQSDDEVGVLGTMFEETIRRLRGYIGEISDVLGSIADGDLTQDAVQDYLGDFQSIKRSLDRIQSAMNSTMGQIAVSAAQVSSGSEQVSSSAQNLAQGATEQASSVEEISATIANISDHAQKTSAAAAEAGDFVNQAGAQLGVSMEHVKDLNVAMENISRSSREINSIISTIENIAFQINILALNAAVEAARAGSAGKGFAVVADEVSNLASKSDVAAKATQELIESSIRAVTEGSDVVNKVTEALDRTGELAGNVTSRMSVVVDAIEKQRAAIVQVSDGIDQIASVVQTNSATSEECAAASEELSSQAGLLKNLIGAFRLKNM